MNKKKTFTLLIILIILIILLTFNTIHASVFKIILNVSNPSTITSNLNTFVENINKSTSLVSNSNNVINVKNNVKEKINESLLISMPEIAVKNVKVKNNYINDKNINNNSNNFNIINESKSFLLETNQNTVKSNQVELINNSIYCWHEDILSPSYIDIIVNRLKSLNITDAYISMSDIESYKSAIKKLKENGISVYYLDGHSKWYKDVNSIKEVIDKVDSYNRNNPNIELSGIVLDIEPYSRDEYKTDVISGFETYANAMEVSYSYASSKNVKMVIVIPYWYDKYMTESKYTKEEKERASISFDKLIKSSDRVSVMNYYKSKMTSHIETELNYAKKYGKEIESIAEFSKTNADINEKITFYTDTDPIKASNIEWKKINNTYNYDKLTFSYHHLNMILELYNEIKRYTFEFIDENSNIVSSGKYVALLANGEKLENSVTSDIYVEPNTNFTISLKNYDISSYDGEEILKNGTIKRTYHVISKEKYQLEIYAKYSDESKISKGTMKLINTNTLEEFTADCNETNEYFFFRNIYSDVPYKVLYIDEEDNEYPLELAISKNNESIQTTISNNGNIIIPKGFKTSLYISPKFIIEKKIEEPPQSYLLELYPKLWNGKKYASVREGQIKLIDVSTGQEITNTIRGDSKSGFYTYFTVLANTYYSLRILDSSGNDLGNSIVSYKYKDANGVQQNFNSEDGIFNLKSGLQSILYPTFNFE